MVPQDLLVLQGVRDPPARLGVWPGSRVHGDPQDEPGGRRLHKHPQEVPCRPIRAQAKIMHFVSNHHQSFIQNVSFTSIPDHP